jgi:hypothetical protein
MMRLPDWIGFSALMLIYCGLSACASSEVGSGPECVSDVDCGVGQICNVLLQECQALRPDPDPMTNNTSVNNATTNNNATNNNATNNNATNNNATNNNATNNNATNNNATNNGTPDMSTPDMADPDMAPDMPDPQTCNPPCGANEVCENGVCVESCMPPCQAPEICTANGCEIPACTQEGQSCDLNNRNQGQFACLADNSGQGVCVTTCPDAFAASTCATGEYCWETNDVPAVSVCYPSQCGTDGDCVGGTCINFDNNFGICLTSGTVAIGGSCDVTLANTCVQGAYCRRLASGSSAGVCSQTCDPWGGSTCGTGKVCSYVITTREGVCMASDSTGTSSYASCTTLGDGCANAVQCFGLNSNPPSNACLKYCRAQQNDCTGLSLASTCDIYTWPGDRSLGLCFPTCISDAECGARRCVGSSCRSICTAASVITDCCGGTSPCDWTCVNGLCE